MSSEIAIRVEEVSKLYQIYDQPHDRLKQAILPRLQRLAGAEPRRYHREFQALRDVSFTIGRGETVGIVGRNGSGKSTLLQIICGTLTPSSGNIESNGRIGALLELGSGFNPEFTGRENVYLNGAILGLDRQEIDARYDRIKEFAEIGDFIDRPVKTYSSGMFVRLAFSIQANVDAEILIVDEALAVGDAAFVHRCMHRFHQLQEQGTTILFVSHDASAVKRLCDRALYLESGMLKADGDANSVVDAYLSTLFMNVRRDAHTLQKPADVPQDAAVQKLEKTLLGDLREGDQSLEIVSVGLRTADRQALKSVRWGESFRLCVAIMNNAVDPGTTLCAGYIVRDPRGIEIASTNSMFEGTDLRAPATGGELAVEFLVTLPMLSPGVYAITPGVSVVTLGSEFSIRDRIVNSLLLTVIAGGPINTPMRFPTTVSGVLK